LCQGCYYSSTFVKISLIDHVRNVLISLAKRGDIVTTNLWVRSYPGFTSPSFAAGYQGYRERGSGGFWSTRDWCRRRGMSNFVDLKFFPNQLWKRGSGYRLKGSGLVTGRPGFIFWESGRFNCRFRRSFVVVSEKISRTFLVLTGENLLSLKLAKCI